MTTCGKRTKRSEKVRHEKAAVAQADGAENPGVKAVQKSKPKVEETPPKKNIGAARRLEVHFFGWFSFQVVIFVSYSEQKESV